MKNLFLVLVVIVYCQVHSQNFNWVSISSGINGEEGKVIQEDSQGNLIVAGYFQGTVDFDPGSGVENLTSNGAEDIFLQKLNSNGDLIWVKQFGGTGSETSFSLDITSSDEVILAGYFASSIDADPGANTVTLSPVGSTNSFIVKLDSSGDYLWSKHFGGGSANAICLINNVRLDFQGNICIFGMFSGTVDFNPGLGTQFGSSLMFSDLFFLKLDASGNFVWVRFINGNSFDYSTGFEVAPNGDFIGTGRFQGTADFNPGIGVNSLSSTFSSFDSYVVRLDANGNYVWAKVFGGQGQCFSNAIDIDPLGNIYTWGSFDGSVDFDPSASTFSLTSSGQFDAYLQKLDANGNFISAIKIGSTGQDSGASLEIDNAGNIYASGTFSNTVDFNPGAGVSNFTTSGTESFLLKLDSNIDYAWLYHIADGQSSISSTCVASNNAIYCTGSFQNTVDFNPFGTPNNKTAMGSLDAFVIGLSQASCSTTFGIDVQSTCYPFTWIDGNTYSSNNNSATHILTNAGGCDSVVTLNLTIWDCTNLNSTFCGATGVAMNQLVNAENRPGALQYRFRITGTNSQAWPNNEFVYTSNSKNFRFQFIPGAMWGETYGVEVAYSTVPGVFGPYGASCDVTLQSLAVQPLSVVNPAVCGTTVTMDDFVNTAWVPGALAYRFQIVGSNANAWPSNTYVQETIAPVRKFKFGQIPGALFGETYAVAVAYQDGSGNWTSYGAPCNVTIETPSTQLQMSDCGIVGVTGIEELLADNVLGASGYRFRITGANSAGWPMDQTTVDRPNRVFWMNLANGWLPGETYTIEVAVQDAAGNYGAYGSACSITMFGVPSLAIVNVDAAAQTKATIEGAFGATASHNPFTRDFALNLVNANDTDAINVAIYDMSGKLIEASSVNPMDIESARFGANLATGMYMIQVTQGTNQAVIRQVKN